MEYSKIVLDEPFHLSYPYVFEWDGGLYDSESATARHLRLYRAVDFLVAGNFSDLGVSLVTMGYSGMKTGGGLWPGGPLP